MPEVDRSEPLELVRLLDTSSAWDVQGLNDAGWADFRWQRSDGNWRHVERKTWHDIENETGQNEVEVIIRKYLSSQPQARLILLVEGVVEPAPTGLLMYRKRSGQNVFIGGVPSGSRRSAYKESEAWLNQVREYLDVRQTSSMAASAVAIHSWYENDQKEDHSTFNRHFKQITWNPNPQVTRLLGLASNDTNIGVITAENLIRVYGTAWHVASASPDDIAAKVKGISKEGARNFLRKIGRLDV